MVEQNDNNPTRKPLIYYFIIASLIIMLLNAFVFPSLLARQVQEVGYSDFLKMVDAGQITEVSLDQNNEQLIFIAKTEEGQEKICKTAVFPDDSLRARLEDAGVTFSAQIPTQNSPLLNFILGWVLPIVFFLFMGRILSSENISGSTSKAIHSAPGVYMLRLINGDNVKVQKIIVK